MSRDRDERSYLGKHQIPAAVPPLQIFISFLGRSVSGDRLSPPDSGVLLSITCISHVLGFCCCFRGGPSGAGIEQKSQRCYFGPDGLVL